MQASRLRGGSGTPASRRYAKLLMLTETMENAAVYEIALPAHAGDGKLAGVREHAEEQ